MAGPQEQSPPKGKPAMCSCPAKTGMVDQLEEEHGTIYIKERRLRVGEVFPRRIRGVRERYEVDTRRTIEKAIGNLEELAEEAHRRATAKNLSTEARQKWARVETYIYQTINSLAKTHDSQAIMEKLEELTRRVDEYMGEDKAAREEG